MKRGRNCQSYFESKSSDWMEKKTYWVTITKTLSTTTQQGTAMGRQQTLVMDCEKLLPYSQTQVSEATSPRANSRGKTHVGWRIW